MPYFVRLEIIGLRVPHGLLQLQLAILAGRTFFWSVRIHRLISPGLANQRERSIVLDVLRGVAVLLVLGRHLEPCPAELNPAMHWLTSVWARGGWMGVDLFFVLSGFLVSGLLFKEHRLYGEIRIRRFFFRRGLKIYPAFLGFLLIASAWKHLAGGQIGPRRFLIELAFLQNYLPSVWFHTWSLAVEEHFYLLLPILLVPVFRRCGKDPVRALVIVFAVIASVCLALRLLGSDGAYDFYRQTTPTHKRIDSLFAGVLLSALHHYRPKELRSWVERFRGVIVPFALACLAAPFIFPIESTPWLYQIGYSALYVGAALLLAVAVTGRELTHGVFRGIAIVGMDSYSIYLWHAAALVLVAEPLRKHFPPAASWYPFALIYLVASVAIGILMSKLLEWPVLRIRDRYFPSRSKFPQDEITPEEKSALAGGGEPLAHRPA